MRPCNYCTGHVNVGDSVELEQTPATFSLLIYLEDSSRQSTYVCNGCLPSVLKMYAAKGSGGVVRVKAVTR